MQARVGRRRFVVCCPGLHAFRVGGCVRDKGSQRNSVVTCMVQHRSAARRDAGARCDRRALASHRISLRRNSRNHRKTHFPVAARCPAVPTPAATMSDAPAAADGTAPAEAAALAPAARSRPDCWKLFQAALRCIVDHWSLLEIAINQGWRHNGEQSRELMWDELMDNFTERWEKRTVVEEDEIDEYLEIFFDEQFSVQSDTISPVLPRRARRPCARRHVLTTASTVLQVAHLMYQLYRDCDTGTCTAALAILRKHNLDPVAVCAAEGVPSTGPRAAATGVVVESKAEEGAGAGEGTGAGAGAGEEDAGEEDAGGAAASATEQVRRVCATVHHALCSSLLRSWRASSPRVRPARVRTVLPRRRTRTTGGRWSGVVGEAGEGATEHGDKRPGNPPVGSCPKRSNVHSLHTSIAHSHAATSVTAGLQGTRRGIVGGGPILYCRQSGDVRKCGARSEPHTESHAFAWSGAQTNGTLPSTRLPSAAQDVRACPWPMDPARASANAAGGDELFERVARLRLALLRHRLEDVARQPAVAPPTPTIAAAPATPTTHVTSTLPVYPASEWWPQLCHGPGMMSTAPAPGWAMSGAGQLPFSQRLFAQRRTALQLRRRVREARLLAEQDELDEEAQHELDAATEVRAHRQCLFRRLCSAARASRCPLSQPSAAQPMWSAVQEAVRPIMEQQHRVETMLRQVLGEREGGVAEVSA